MQRTRVVVDHDSLLALLLEGESSVDSTPIEFDGGSDAVDARSQYNNTVVVELDIVSTCVIGSVLEKTSQHDTQYGTSPKGSPSKAPQAQLSIKMQKAERELSQPIESHGDWSDTQTLIGQA